LTAMIVPAVLSTTMPSLFSSTAPRACKEVGGERRACAVAANLAG
jgi:hypothetical protein